MVPDLTVVGSMPLMSLLWLRPTKPDELQHLGGTRSDVQSAMGGQRRAWVVVARTLSVGHATFAKPRNRVGLLRFIEVDLEVQVRTR